MAVSNKSKCAIRCMMHLALSDKDTLTAQDIYEKEDLSKRYIEQVFADLKRQGLVKSVKGKNGGYYLARELRNIKAKDIVIAVEGNTLFGEPGDNSTKKDVEIILQSALWDKLDHSVMNILDHVTLQDLVSKYNDTYSQMFYI